MTIGQFVRVIISRRRMVVAIVGVFLVAACVANLFLPNTYVAETSLVIDPKGVDPVTGASRPAQGPAAMLATQVDIISSHNVALKVVDDLRLHERQYFLDRFAAREDKSRLRNAIAAQLIANLNVRPARDSNVIDVRYSARDPMLAAEVANAFATAYMRTNLELAIDPARRRASWFDEQLTVLRERLHLAQSKLADYQRSHRIVATDAPLDIENSRLEGISNQLVAAQSAMYEAQTRRRQMLLAISSGRSTQVPAIVESELLRALKADLSKAEGKLANAAQSYGPNHPQYLNANAEVRKLRERLDAEMRDILGSLEQAAAMAEQRTAEVQASLDAQKEQILQLRAQRDSASVLNRDVDSAQRAYDSALQRASEARLESRIEQTSIAVLNTAAVPVAASGPRRSLNLVLALVMGALLSIGAATALEMLHPRVRATSDLSAGLGLPVLTEIPAARAVRSLVPQYQLPSPGR